MSTIPTELLQELGLNKYEAEAYYTLLTQGPLTGYELGKRSQVPLSRSYDVLERLSQRGLALIQPGDPARYKALEPDLFLGQVRSTMEHTLNTLASTLAKTSQQTESGEFWVVRTRLHILECVRTLCAKAAQTLQLALPEPYINDLTNCLASAHRRNCTVTLLTGNAASTIDVLLLIDTHEALLGSLEPEENCQVIVSTNTALITVITSYFQSRTTQFPASTHSEEQQPSFADETRCDWLEWENRKQQRLWKNQTGQRIA